MTLFNSRISLVFCLDELSIFESGELKSLTISMRGLMCGFSCSSVSTLMNSEAPVWVHKSLKYNTFLVDFSFSKYVVSSFSITADLFWFEVYLVRY